MALLPPISIVFDTTALLAGKTLNWQEFSRLGECYVPEAVLEQMQFMCDRASEPETESTAREFSRFYPTSGWKKTSLKAEHPLLKPAPGHNLSKRARLALDVVECCYGLALRYPDRLVVLVANEQPMLQQVMGLQTKNLCGMPVSALLQWVRSQRRPPVVNHHLQLMRSAKPGQSSQSSLNEAGTRRTSTATTRPTSTTAAASTAVRPGMYTAKRQRSSLRSRQFFSLLSNLVSLVILLVVLAAIWRFVSPASFNQFWQNLPILGTQR
ncbi:MAG: PIN domain-containing protein [Leptolyngbyaceae cyanobacterium bins.302]|nr:PIN domain-containing protein [Leptolyngbyaceae cyanobacterium bins.302]